ncbi:MAG: hypothetical protein CL678_09300 [Bdellovibrionaceae bacterium]|nr:hypothetical protein [Pseudobdellovibrionaceae bacterium]
MMTDYLLGKSNQEDLDQFLKNVGLFEVYHDKGLPGEVQIGLDSFYVPREIEVDASFFENISVNDDRSVYINYPVDSLDFPTFKKGEFKKIIFKTRSYQHYNSGFKYLNLLKETIRSYFKKHPKKKIDLRIFYTKKKTRLPNGLEKNTITFLEINYELDPYEDILLQISSVFKEEAEVVVLGVISRFYRIFNLDLNQMIVFGFDPEKRALLSSYLTRFKEALDRLKQRDYFLYSAVLSATLAFDDPHFGRTSLIDIGDDETLHMNSEDLDRYLNELASEKDKEFHERIMKYQIKDLARYNRYDDDYYLTGDFLYTESFLMELFEKIHQKEKSLTVSEISEKYRSELINPMIGIFNCIDSYFLKAKLLFLSEQNPNLIELKMVKYDSGNSYYSDLSIGFRPDIFEKYTMQEVVQMIPMLLSHKKAFKKYGYLVLRENSSGVVVMNVTRPGYFMDEYKKVFRKDTRKIRKIIKSGGCF